MSDQDAPQPAEAPEGGSEEAPAAPAAVEEGESPAEAPEDSAATPSPADQAPAEELPEGEGEEGTVHTDADGGLQVEIAADMVVPPEEAAVEEDEEPAKSAKDMLRERILLSHLTEDMWNETHDEVLERFLNDASLPLLAGWIDREKLVLDFQMPRNTVEEIVYFAKNGPVMPEVTEETFQAAFQTGSVEGRSSDRKTIPYIESLLRQMTGIFTQLCLKNTQWPDSIKNDFSAQLHKFMGSLTDTRWKMAGKTVLYIPQEGFGAQPEDAAKNKELVQRLETSMIHWARQIKEVLSSQDATEIADGAGPLEEIEFWKSRCLDLSGISQQLDKQGVKHITAILDAAKSSYVAPFLKLSGLIKEGSRQAESNLKFLMVLRDPCIELSDAAPKDIPHMLPKIINLIRMVWVNSEFYKSREKLTGIFKKLSNEIIKRCCAVISLDNIFDGFVQSSMQTLHECIECCEKYKEIYDRSQKLHHKFSSHGWVLDKTNIFAQIDAFIQRCKDLLEVCECQVHFARREEGSQTEMPHFAGQKGPEIVRGLKEIETVFERNLDILRAVKKTILDVKATTWHDDYNRFRAGIKDLEVMMQNVVQSAFDTVVTVEQGVEVLDVFMHLNSRESVRRTLDKKTVEVYALFNEELNGVKKELTSKFSPQSPAHPKFAGQAHWARQLKKRIERSSMMLDRAHFLPQIGQGEEARAQYQQLCQALDEYVRKTFFEWTHSIDREPMKLLEVPLMCRSGERPGMIDINFDKLLLKLFQEISYWERLMFEIPHYAADAYTKREELRSLREFVLLVVRDYNRIIAALSPEERGLFRERIKSLDKKVHAGLTKLTWATKGISDWFIQDCRQFASKVQAVVDDYKSANMGISLNCKKISELLLTHIDGKRIYENLEFEDDQAKHREGVQKKLHATHDMIIDTMKNTYKVFRDDAHEVQQHWVRYTEKMDRMVEEAFRLNVKWSLQELSKAINGDGKSGPSPLFKVRVELQGDKIEFAPKLRELSQIVGDVGPHLTSTISGIRRLPDILTKKKSNRAPIHEMVAKDEEVKKAQNVIMAGMTANTTSLQQYLQTWDSFREIWEINKDAFIRRYQKLGPQVSSFDSDIARYTEVANNVQTHDTILNIQFVLLDCSPLKFAILSHCQEWQNKFTTLLHDIATHNLAELHEYLTSYGKRIMQAPQNLDELGESLGLWEQLHGELPEVEAKFPPLHDQFGILEKYEVTIDEKNQQMLNELSGEWIKFQDTLQEADAMLKKNKDKFKTGLLAQSEEFKKQVSALVSDFRTNGPFSAGLTTAEALENIEKMKEQLEAVKRQEQTLRKGLGIFKIDQPPSKEVQALEKELEAIETVWQLTKEWEGNWESWKSGQFTGIESQEMETQCVTIYKKLNKLSRDLKDKNWEIVETSKNKVDQFRRTMPLISDLKNKAMRPRHWTQIQAEMGRQFDHTAEDFTLEKIIEYGFDQYADMINEVSGAATKELAIEQSIAAIKETWNNVELDLATYKEKERGLFKLRSTEEIYQTLEDNQVQLSTMKASRFVKAFEEDVDYWERTLSHILETVEMLLTVQRQWLYLENIFFGDEIRKQLPRESAEFDDVNDKWKVIMQTLNKDRNALRGTHQKG